MRYRDDITSQVSKSADVQYGTAPDNSGNPVALKLDFYQPAFDPVARRPVFIWIHGGGFSTGNKADGAGSASAMARRGYLAISLGYRLLATGPCGGSGPVPGYCYTAAYAAQHDAQAAVRYVRKNAAALHADPNRIAMGGASAGAITSLLAGWRANDPGTSGNPGPSSAIRAAVPVSGGLPRNDFINAGDAPAMFFNGTADPTVPFSWATGNVLSMRAAGVLVDIMPFVGAGHSLIPQFGRTIVDQTSYFLWYTMDLAHAAR